VEPTEANAQLGDLHVLDVREPDEWRAGHIAGAQHIPLGQLRQRLDEVPKGRTILAVCRHGNRSDVATRGLRTLGYTVENLDGGVTAWKRAGLSLVDADDGPGRVI
jgi:rhodanese-related sulfurtransferase